MKLYQKNFTNKPIDDNYAKYVISMDKVDFSRDGIKHINIIDFLMGDEFWWNECWTTKSYPRNYTRKILNLIRKNPYITQVEMAKIIGVTRDGIAYNIRILREKGIIERDGVTKNGIWKIV